MTFNRVKFNAKNGIDNKGRQLSDVPAPVEPTDATNKAFVDAQLVSKVDKVAGKGLSSEDFTTAEKTKLAGIDFALVSCSMYLLDPLPELLNATVYLEGKALLSDAVISFFTVTDWVNGTHTVPAVANKATLTLAVPVYPCDPLSITVVAVDSYLNESKVVTRTVAVQDTIVMPPVPVVPVAPIASLYTLTVPSGALTLSNGTTDGHLSTDWELWTGAGRTGTLVWSSISDTLNKIYLTIPTTVVLTVSSKYYLVVRYRSVTYGLSSYAEASFSTSNQKVPAIGEPFQGGYYAGNFTLGGSLYALVVAPKAQGDLYFSSSLTAYGVSQPGSSVIDGLDNSSRSVAAAHKTIRSLTIGGFTDWYIPSHYELELIYFNLSSGKYPPSTLAPYSFSGPWSGVYTGYSTYPFIGKEYKAPAGNPYAVPARGEFTTTYATDPPLSGYSANRAENPTYWSKFSYQGNAPTEEFTESLYYISSSFWVHISLGVGVNSNDYYYSRSLLDGYVSPYEAHLAGPFRVRATRKVLLS
jgi:hypothetical protein